MAKKENYTKAYEALERIQQFDVTTLGREGDLGTQLSFTSAVPLAEKLVGIYKRIPLTTLEDFTDNQLNTISAQAQADFNIFQQILDFNAQADNAHTTRTNILNSLNTRRDQLFDHLWQYVAFAVARNTDTSLLETQARATIQTIKDESGKLTRDLGIAKGEAETALTAIRAAASEQGVSQQASYFKDEAVAQESLAVTWLGYTYKFAMGLGGFAVLSLFLHRIEWIKPSGYGEMLQLITSKFLIFAVLAYLLIMAARNYTTHKHNAVVNRHRQNALLTYRALVEATDGKGTEDIILAHAASCIFSPQETGFSNGKGDSTSGSKSVLELMTKSPAKAA